MRNLFKFLLVPYGLLLCSPGCTALAQTREKVAAAYTSQIGVREATGHNDGVMVETYLHYCGLGKGEPWCASFVCWTFGQASVSNPRSGYCPNLFTPGHVIYKRSIHKPQKVPEQGDVWGLYFPDKRRVAHVGFVDQWGSKYVITVEGNTNEAGSREGDGVYRKRRPISSIYVVAKYIK
ncbi:CHAP domain-containing protein [Mucilaginibacter gracilis]|uniref:CHAP domain-containing protein n=1 Tax=Mucilaginibacter gracilis TaxID=423350 RepID=A0A495J2G7_9SPHI|nr:CHAP domain-containing protein [Mucilaginibacter gracilis]RKR83176.1 CHAP domain-containing protein [Mucilaginibacter gracilis]